MEKTETTDQILATAQNWRIIEDHIQTKCMEKMEIPQGTLTEAVFLSLAAGGEMGELQNIVKKMWRDGVSEELHSKLRKECADVLIYMDHLLNAFGFSATDLIVDAVNENIQRPNFQPFLEGLEEALKKAQN